jgi:hypothetical protein
VAGTFEIDDLGVWRRVLTDYDAQAIYIVGDGYGRSFDTTAPAEVRIEFETTAGGLELTWSSGTLESSDRVDSGYSTVAGASSPFTVAPGTTGNRFYRVRVQ